MSDESSVIIPPKVREAYKASEIDADGYHFRAGNLLSASEELAMPKVVISNERDVARKLEKNLFSLLKEEHGDKVKISMDKLSDGTVSINFRTSDPMVGSIEDVAVRTVISQLYGASKALGIEINNKSIHYISFKNLRDVLTAIDAVTPEEKKIGGQALLSKGAPSARNLGV